MGTAVMLLDTIQILIYDLPFNYTTKLQFLNQSVLFLLQNICRYTFLSYEITQPCLGQKENGYSCLYRKKLWFRDTKPVKQAGTNRNY